jgi:hypothetical protein
MRPFHPLGCFESDTAWLVHDGGIRSAVYLTRPAVCGCLIDRSSGAVQKVNGHPIMWDNQLARAWKPSPHARQPATSGIDSPGTLRGVQHPA